MDSAEKLLLLGVGAFVGARYLAGRISNNSGAVTVNPKQELPKVPEPKNTGIVPPNFDGRSLVDDRIEGGARGQLMQQMEQFRKVSV